MFDAAERYQQAGLPLIILAGKEYGSGSSRDWAAKGPFLLVSVTRGHPNGQLPSGPGGEVGRGPGINVVEEHFKKRVVFVPLPLPGGSGFTSLSEGNL